MTRHLHRFRCDICAEAFVDGRNLRRVWTASSIPSKDVKEAIGAFEKAEEALRQEGFGKYRVR